MTQLVHFDGLVGPTHNYAGLSHGNVASMENQAAVSHPKRAALEGIDKMLEVASLGIPQGFFPPAARPKLSALRALGFRGDHKTLLTEAKRASELLFHSIWSASSMWTANAATVTASADSRDGSVHFTAANLASKYHRSLEAHETSRALRSLFSGPCFVHHCPVPPPFGDEGAANHTRLYADRTAPGVDVFVYGRTMANRATKRFVARQHLVASEAVARQHGVRHPFFLQQNPAAIDAGAFHNDVVSVGEGLTWLMHEAAFSADDVARLKKEAATTLGAEKTFRVVTEADLPLEDAIKSYLFNSQLVPTAAGADPKMVLIAPQEAEDSSMSRAVVESWIADGALAGVRYVNLRESMRNGGGPACLRLRVPLTEAELAAVHPKLMLTPARAESLRSWVKAHYRESLSPLDLSDPAFVTECFTALDELTSLLDLGGDFYEFQRDATQVASRRDD